MQQKSKKVIVVGGGPAGIMAAATSAYNGDETVLVEKNEKLGKKLFITGKGRCNVTNACDIQDFFANIAHNANFCYSALYSFPQERAMELIQSQGVELKVERGNRVFPRSDKSSDIIKALESYLSSSGTEVLKRTRLEDIFVSNGKVTGVKINGKIRSCDKLILALGGASYVSTGSDGKWEKMLENLGHTVKEFRPALAPMKSDDKDILSLQGLSLKNVSLKAYKGNKCIFDQLGEMLFAHFGISGPLTLTLSSMLESDLSGISVEVDLKPGLSEDQLDKRILRDFAKFGGKMLKNALDELLPQRLIAAVIKKAQLSPETPVSGITQKQRERIVNTLKHFSIKITGFGDLNEAIITRGGIDVKEIDPSTMQSKIIKGLYFAGEMIDIDAFTGGFNIQLALSTGFLAGE